MNDFKDKTGNFSLVVKNKPGTEKFERTANLILKLEEFSTLIQTDKAIYKPGDLVQYKILALDENTKPSAPKKITLTIINNMTTPVEEKKDIVFKNGIYEGNYPLPKELPLGLWNFVVNQSGFEVNRNVKVF
jgi:CD109 antigen